MRIFAFCLPLVLGCAHVKKPDVEELKPTIDTFHQRARWRDYRGVAEFIVEEKRATFIKARLTGNDDRDLYITDYQLEDADVAPGAEKVAAVSKISWYRLPNTTEKSAVVTSLFIWRDGKWLLQSQDDGPFEDLKDPRQPKAP